jgi:hypothetical protein
MVSPAQSIDRPVHGRPVHGQARQCKTENMACTGYGQPGYWQGHTMSRSNHWQLSPWQPSLCPGQSIHSSAHGQPTPWTDKRVNSPSYEKFGPTDGQSEPCEAQPMSNQSPANGQLMTRPDQHTTSPGHGQPYPAHIQLTTRPDQPMNSPENVQPRAWPAMHMRDPAHPMA